MGFDENMRNRKLNRLQDYDYSREGYYFVTVCVQDKQRIFGEIHHGEMALNKYGNIINDAWRWLGDQYDYVALDECVIMPDHIHGIICIYNARRGGSRTAPTIKPLGRLIGAFKTVSTKHINQMRNTPGMQLWQRSFYDHIIRSEEDLNRVREYIANNPLQWDGYLGNKNNAEKQT